LHDRGAEVSVTLRGRSAESGKRAAGLRQLDSEAALAVWADVVLSILPPGEALGLAKLLAPVLGPRGDAVIYADCNAVSPATVAEVAASLPGIRFVDIGIIGGPPGASGPGPRLYASGDAALALAPLAEWGIDVRAIEGGIGAASALKMSYAGITKGVTALGSAMALGAIGSGAAAALRAELQASQPDLVRILDRSVPDMFGKAYRWVAEMEEISAFLGDSPAAPIYAAMAQLYAAIAADRERSGPLVADLAAFYDKTSPPRA
jgi:3-hydroxyisobutyrate dehydrogenase-like beta-hydroxyacid dehydrogenase